MGCTEVNPFEVLLNYSNKEKQAMNSIWNLVKSQNKWIPVRFNVR